MKEAFYNKTKETIYLVMELVDGLTLKRYLKESSSLSDIGGLDEELCKVLFQ
jgi:hypothetical protein